MEECDSSTPKSKTSGGLHFTRKILMPFAVNLKPGYFSSNWGNYRPLVGNACEKFGLWVLF